MTRRLALKLYFCFVFLVCVVLVLPGVVSVCVTTNGEKMDVSVSHPGHLQNDIK